MVLVAGIYSCMDLGAVISHNLYYYAYSFRAFRKKIYKMNEEELEFTSEQEQRIDEVYTMVYELCQYMTDNGIRSYSQDIVGPIADNVAEMLSLQGYKVHFPVITENDDGDQYISEYF